MPKMSSTHGRSPREKLRIDVVAPFSFEVDGRRREYLAWVANVGRKRGIVLCGTWPPEFVIDRDLAADAAREGYQSSFINVRAYSAFNRDKFIEALTDWGFFGPAEERPEWLPP